MSFELARVGVESRNRAEENLPLHPKKAGDLHDLRHLLQLQSEHGIRKLRFQRRPFGERLIQRCRVGDAVGQRGVGRLGERHAAVERQKTGQRVQTGLRRGRGIEPRELQVAAGRNRHWLRFYSGTQQRISSY